MRKKTVSFYLVIDQNQSNQILTITSTKKEAIEYGYQFLKIKHYDHYNRWCELKGFSPSSEQAWFRYFMNVLTIEEKSQYAVAKRKYTVDTLAAIMRMFGGCTPLGCSFDTETEYIYLKSKLATQEAAAEWVKKNMKQPEETAEEIKNGKQ